MKLYFIILSALVIITGFLFSGCTDNNATQKEELVPVRLVELKKEHIQKSIMSSGQFTTDDETILSFKTGGVIKAIYVKEGDEVRKGQLLATLEMTEINAGVLQSEAAYEKALRDYNRIINLFKDSVATLVQSQDAKTALDIATQQLNIARYNKNYSEINAIGDGFVLKKFVNEGQLVGPGTPVLQTNEAGKGNWILKAGVSDIEWSSIELNDKAVVEIDALPGEKFEAVVVRKSKGVDPISGTLSTDIKLVSQPEGKLASGLFGKVKINSSRTVSYWVIPYESVLDGDKNNGYVFITNDYKKVQKVKINIADMLEDNILVNGGLENAKALVITGSAYLNDGSEISAINMKEE